MPDVEIRSRPFACHALGFMMPDGMFDTALGVQELNAHVTNTTGGLLGPATELYLEAVSDPAIAVTPMTHSLDSLPASATTVLPWRVDMTNASPGSHRVSFVANAPGGVIRIIKKIFVTRTTHDPATGTFNIEFPQGRLNVEFLSMFGPADKPCCTSKPDHEDDDTARRRRVVGAAGGNGESFLDVARDLARDRTATFLYCHNEYVPAEVRLTFVPNPSYPGQYSDLPFNDPWWKVVLCVLAVLALIAAGIVAAVQGSGSVSVGTGNTPTGSPVEDCCGVRARGGSSSYAVAGLVALAAGLATVAGLSDDRDAIRRGQDNTDPGPAAVTVSETLTYRYKPLDDIVPGTPFRAGIDWTYQRFTAGGGAPLEHSVQDEVQANVHVLTRYEIDAPDVVRSYKREAWVVSARFIDAAGDVMRGSQLFVQCFLLGPGGELIRVPMRDDGIPPDKEATDGIYTAAVFFSSKHVGLWTYLVVAQDVNAAAEDMEPEDAAKIIGGMLLTPQVSIGFQGGDCPLVPDGHVQVL